MVGLKTGASWRTLASLEKRVGPWKNFKGNRIEPYKLVYTYGMKHLFIIYTGLGIYIKINYSIPEQNTTY